MNLGTGILAGLAALGAAAAVMPTGSAMAQDAGARTTVDLNMRAGPGTGHRVILTIPQGRSVPVFGCTEGYRWCETAYRGRNGWVSARYLDGERGGRVADVGERLGIGIINFALNAIIGEQEKQRRPRRHARAGEVCFYQNHGFRGERFCRSAGQRDARMTGKWNDRISSIAVGRGASVRVCQHFGQNGWCERYDRDVRRLRGNRNDAISSYRVMDRRTGRNRDGRGSDRAGRVCFYEHHGFRGDSFCAGAGERARRMTGGWNDRISSIRVSGGRSVQVCEHNRFNGWCRTVSGNVPRLRGERNDAISSFRVR